jgi:hypothetical protein
MFRHQNLRSRRLVDDVSFGGNALRPGASQLNQRV